MGKFTSPITVDPVGGVDVINVPEIVETTSGSNIVLRGDSIGLLALLESGDIDCAFEYESVARQHGLKYVRLPASIDLGEPAQRASYRTVEVKLESQRFASVPARLPRRPHPLRLHDPGRTRRTRRLPPNSPRFCWRRRAAHPREQYQPVLTPPALDNAGRRTRGGETSVRGVRVSVLRDYRHPVDPGPPARSSGPPSARAPRR